MDYPTGFERSALRLWLVRDVDESENSNGSVVADGVVFPSGTVVVEWREDATGGVRTSENRLEVHRGDDGIEDVLAVHDGRVEVRFQDDPERDFEMDRVSVREHE